VVSVVVPAGGHAIASPLGPTQSVPVPAAGGQAMASPLAPKHYVAFDGIPGIGHGTTSPAGP